MNRASTTTEKGTSWTRGSCSHCVICEELLFVELLWVWGCRPWSDNTTNCVVARLTVDKSLNQTYFCFFCFVLSNKYLCTILVLFSFLLIIELPTLVTWCHLVIIGCQCPQCGFTMQLSFWTVDEGQNLTHHSSWRLKSQRLLQCFSSCFCLTFFDVVFVSSPLPPHPRMCLYYACVCIYSICVFISTLYMYTYTYAVFVTCGENSTNSPDGMFVFALLVHSVWPYQTLPRNKWETPNLAETKFDSWLKIC